MAKEQEIMTALIQKFPFLEGKIRVQRVRRIFAEMELANFRQVFDHAANEMKFTILCTITGSDEVNFFTAQYYLANEQGVTLNLKAFISKENPVIKTVSDRFPAAQIYERELIDLLGIKVEGLGEGNRYPLPDNWPEGQYPLRKDWKAESLKVFASKAKTSMAEPDAQPSDTFAQGKSISGKA
jgi:Ni,Fe-hydrogenase III component G